MSGSPAENLGNTVANDVVEVGLLLPAPWANALMELSRTRDQSVGQILRSMIGHALQKRLLRVMAAHFSGVGSSRLRSIDKIRHDYLPR